MRGRRAFRSFKWQLRVLQEARLRELYEEYGGKRGSLLLITERMPGAFTKSQISTHLRRLGLRKRKASSLHTARNLKWDLPPLIFTGCSGCRENRARQDCWAATAVTLQHRRLVVTIRKREAETRRRIGRGRRRLLARNGAWCAFGRAFLFL